MFEEIGALVDREDWASLSNLKENEYCTICCIRKPTKCRHCPNVNLCIPKYHGYSYFFDKPVFFANELLYFSLLLFETIAVATYVICLIAYFGSNVFEHGFLMCWFNAVFMYKIEG